MVRQRQEGRGGHVDIDAEGGAGAEADGRQLGRMGEEGGSINPRVWQRAVALVARSGRRWSLAWSLEKGKRTEKLLGLTTCRMEFDSVRSTEVSYGATDQKFWASPCSSAKTEGLHMGCGYLPAARDHCDLDA